MKNLVSQIYTQKNNFILIGLTGKTGSGCSTIANILEQGYKDYKAVNEKDKYIQQKKDRIIKNFASKVFIDKKFYVIKPSTMIMMIFTFEKSIFFKEIGSIVQLLNQSENEENLKELKDKCKHILGLYNAFKIFSPKENKFEDEQNNKFEELLSNFEFKNKKPLMTIIQNKRSIYEKSLSNETIDELTKEIYSLFGLTTDNIVMDENYEYKKLTQPTNKQLENKFEMKIEITNLLLEKLAKNHSKNFIDLYERYNNVIQSKREVGELSIQALQSIGDLVRNQVDIFRLPTYINLMVKALRAKSKIEKTNCYIVIDSLKNPFEIVFFKEKYSAYYTFSIHSKDETIYSRFSDLNNIKRIHKREMYQSDTEKQKESLDSKKDFNSQNIIECIQRSDIYIDNNLDKKDFLYKQIFKYLSLIVHPGLITPTKDENIMQLALNAKFNSGCISRQVGAVVLNKYDSVKSIGWNEVPEGQIPCNLRSHNELLNNSPLMDYSKYEKTKLRVEDSFKYIFTKDKPNQYKESDDLGLHDAFCFKQVQNSKDGNKNQVYTRSLHAEENAFLQLAKYGNSEIIGGQLFTTASPCFLCAKKAYQLGIKRIVYIEAYPDISNEQIFDCGNHEIIMVHFRGAIGLAYQKLYEPLFSYKDELKAINVQQ